MDLHALFKVKPHSGLFTTKTALVMQLTSVILLAACLQVSAFAHAQTVSISGNHLSLPKVFKEIRQQTGYNFIYTNEELQKTSPVTLHVKDASLKEVLEECLASQPVDYMINDKIIIIKPKNSIPNAALLSLIKISGRVTDSATHAPLAGVTIQVKGSTIGTMTDNSGNFNLEVPDNAVLVISYLGYNKKEIAVNNESNINIDLSASTTGLNQLVVVGYGVQKKVNLTGADESLSGKIFENRPITNIGQGLQGEFANLNVNITNGAPNTTPSLNVRGGTSFANNSFLMGSPLVLVDGVQMDISQLDPNDIASISVLKDAASAAIYGARAAYGVVLITTKHGRKSQAPQIKYVGDIQWNQPSAVPNLMSAYDIQKAAMNAYTLTGQSVPSNMQTQLDAIKAHMDDPQHAPVYYTSPGGSIVWVDDLNPYSLALKKSAPMQKHTLSVSGGGKNTTYYASLGYMNQDGIYRFNTDKYKRYNALLDLTTDVTKWFSVNLKSVYSFSQYTEPVSPAGKGGWWVALAHEPERNVNMPIKTPVSSPVGVMYTDNILSFMQYGSLNEESKENNMLYIAPVLTPLKGWNIKGDFSYLSYNYRQKEAIPELDRIVNDWNNPDNVYTSPSSVQRWSDHSNQYTLDLYSDYTFSLGKNNFYALAGFHQEWYDETDFWGEAQDLLSANIPVMSQTQGNEYVSDGESQWALRGAFYRVTYNYNNKYLLESDGRYDGTSKFPHNHRFKFFNSFSGAWRISEEPFVKQLEPVLSNLKIRASYGSLGNQDVANYIYIPAYGTTTQINYLIGGTRPVGVTPPGLVSPNLTWETATTKDLGLDLSLWNKFDFSFDWYNRTTTDILVQGTALPAVLGTTPPTQNSGSLRTLGWDMTTTYRDQLKNGLNFSVRFVLSNYNSRITKFNGNPDKILSSLYTGEDMGEIWGYVTVGTFQTTEQIKKAPSQSLLNAGTWYPGDIQYKDLNGDGKIGPGSNTVSDPGDMKIIGNSTPRLKFGVNIDASWKNFDFNAFFQGVGKRQYWIGSDLYWGAINGGTGTYYVYDHSWTPQTTNAFFPAYRPNAANILPQTKYLINAAYIQLRNVTLGYTIPSRIIHDKLHLNEVKVFAAAYDIWKLTKIPNIFDPEEMSADYPMFKSLAAGIQIQF